LLDNRENIFHHIFMEPLDVYINGQFIGALDVEEDTPKDDLLKLVEGFFPKRTITFKKIIFVPHHCIALVEKILI
jgi:hypothetical protein